MSRKTLTIPFGAGIDRLSGVEVVDPGSFADLSNAYLSRGRMELRRGLAEQALPWGTDCIEIASIKKTGLSAVIIYDSVSRDVRLYLFDGVTTFSLVGTLWSIDVSIAGHVPRVTVAEMYSYLVIAHDEPTFAKRGVTKVFDVTASTLSSLMLNLDRLTSAVVKFRGVARTLNYLLGWGFGTASDQDRAETLRISMPGDPLSFQPEHYFLVGAMGDPVIAAAPIVQDDPNAGGCLIGKDTEWWRLAGYDRASFGMVPADPLYGLLTSRSYVVVNGECFFWSLTGGPRSTTGGPSVDLSLPLDLGGPLPDAAAATSDRVFCWYDPTEFEVVFCMGTFAYVLHLKDQPRRWSYRKYAIELNSAGFLYPASGTGKLNIISAILGSLSSSAPSYAPGDDNPMLTIPWSVSGSGVGDETVEVWARWSTNSSVFSVGGGPLIGTAPWVRIGSAPATDLTTTIAVSSYLTQYDIAIRVVASGTPGAGYTGVPDTWPSTAQDSIVSAGAITSFETGMLWERRSPIEHGFPFVYVGPGASGAAHPELTFRYEQSIDAGSSWQQHAAGDYPAPLAGSVHGNVDRLITVRYRVSVVGPDATAGPSSGTSDVILAPGAPSISTIGPNTGEVQFSRDIHPVLVVVGTHGGDIEVRGRHDPDGTWSTMYTVPGGTVEVLILLDNTGGLDDVHIEATTHLAGFHTPGGAADPGDYSVTTVRLASF